MEIIVYDAYLPASRAKPLLMISKIPDPLANFHTRRGDLAERL